MRRCLTRLAAGMPLALAGCGGAEETAPPNLSSNQVAAELADVRIEPGLWQQEMRIVDVSAQAAPREMVSRMLARRSESRHCISPERAARPEAHFLASREGSRCTSRSFSMNAGRMSGEMECADPRTGERWTARLQGQFSPAAYDYEMILEMPNPWNPQPMLLTSRTTGWRAGACEAAGETKKG